MADESETPLRSHAAAPPTYLLLVPLIPIGLAIGISGSRYSDYWHHGFDVVTGSVLGIVTAWLGFRWYHLPISQGGGWAWAPRSPKRAFGKGIGVITYVDSNNRWREGRDVEAGGMIGDRFNPPPSRDNKSSDGSEEYEMNNIRMPRDYLDSEGGEPSRLPPRRL